MTEETIKQIGEALRLARQCRKLLSEISDATEVELEELMDKRFNMNDPVTVEDQKKWDDLDEAEDKAAQIDSAFRDALGCVEEALDFLEDLPIDTARPHNE